MRILFMDNSCYIPSLGCVFADEIGYDADQGLLWFSNGDREWTVECSSAVANTFIRMAYCDGHVDLTSMVFEMTE